jgi:glycosyltransferase involved in cell wall biosynthesis
MWIDADDVLQGGERLAQALASLPPTCAGLWLPYHYARVDNTGPTTTLFDRERVVRSDIEWQWVNRVHEVLTPKHCLTEHLEWGRSEDILIIHQGEGHNTEASARRNITLLEIDLEADPQDMRALFYLGNQYFALGEWRKAAHYYERSTRAQNPYQLWQSWIYLSMAREKLHDGAGATAAAYSAMDVAPYHPDPYYRLAALALLQGDTQRCEFWTHLGDDLPPAPHFAFKNPLDKSFNARITLGNAYANVGEVSKARREFEHAHSVVPTPAIAEGIENMKRIESETQLANAYVKIISTNHNGFESIPPEVWKFGRVRDLVVPTILARRPNTQPRVVFWCGHPVEPWSPASLNSTGIGGSETAVIEIARRLHSDGYRVDVYNDPDLMEGEYNGIGYWGLNRLTPQDSAQLLVSWRNPQAHTLPITAALRVLWCHDLNRGPDPDHSMSRWDLVCGVSQWHATYLSQVYGCRASYLPNGIDLGRFGEARKRVPFQCVYTSSPDRGLERLLLIWPEIVKNEPTAHLHIAYGWDTIDKMIAMGHGQLAVFKARMEERIANTPNVTWRGRLPQDELAGLFQESTAWLYPTDFTEVSCITAMEAMAGGCVPVVSGVGALPETIGDGGLVVTGNVYTPAWREFYLHCAKAVLHSPDVREKYKQAGLVRAQNLTWDQVYQTHWKPILTPVEALA